MNSAKVKVYKKVPKEVAYKYNGPEDFINNRIDETCSEEKLPDEEVVCFLLGFLRFIFPCYI